MKADQRTLWNKIGMTLSEVMIAIGIAGVLGAVSIPVYKQYTFKAKQAEAKNALGALHATMTSFEAEFDSYTPRFDAIGYSISGELRYRTGFLIDNPPPGNADLPGTATCLITNNAAAKPACASGHPQEYSMLPQASSVASFPGIAVTATTYRAYALSLHNGVDIDSWSIDQAGALLNN